MGSMTRDTTEVMGYISRSVPDGGGIIVDSGVKASEYKNARHLLVEQKTVSFTDARTAPGGGLKSFSLDTHGFTVFQAPAPIEFQKVTGKQIRDEYYPRLAEIAKKLTGATGGYGFNHLIRNESPENVGIAYSRFAHTDASKDSPPSWREMLKERFGVPAEEADTCDICMVNIWHPFDRPAYKDPLCLLDVSSVDLENDISKIPYVHKDGRAADSERTKGLIKGVNNLVGPSFSPKHRWVFCSDMKPDEAWIFKQYDTREGVTRQCFHNSFHDPFHDDKPKETHGRRSIEARFLLTFPKKGAAAAAKL